MQRIIRLARHTEPNAVEWLKVIDTFDQLIAEEAGLDSLVRAAARTAGRSVGIDDSWNGRRVQALVESGHPVSPASRVDQDSIQALIAMIVARRLRGRQPMVVKTDSIEAVAASIEVAGGRVGSAWMLADDRPWTSIDYLILARLANAVAIDAIRTHAEEQARSRVDVGTVERLLASEINEAEAAEAARRAQLPAVKPYVGIAVSERPVSAAGPEVIAQIVVRAIERRGLLARAAVVARAPALIAEAGDALAEAFADLGAASTDRGFALDFGVGEPGDLTRVHRSWVQAREALALRSVAVAGEHVAYFRDLGVLHVLAQVPLDDVRGFPDFLHVLALQESRGSPNDLELLEAYLGSGSLRKTAAQLYLHFSSVEYRLRRIEQALGISLANRNDRFRVEVAIKLVRIHQARDV